MSDSVSANGMARNAAIEPKIGEELFEQLFHRAAVAVGGVIPVARTAGRCPHSAMHRDR